MNKFHVYRKWSKYESKMNTRNTKIPPGSISNHLRNIIMADVSSVCSDIQKALCASWQWGNFTFKHRYFFSISEYQVIRCLVLHYQNRLYLKANEDKVAMTNFSREYYSSLSCSKKCSTSYISSTDEKYLQRYTHTKKYYAI